MTRKSTAFIGLAGPFGYDYMNPAPWGDDSDPTSPNAVLENVLGLLLCYDELVFLAPQFCPADMRELPYVRFVVDDDEELRRAQRVLTEHEQYEAGTAFEWPSDPSFELFSRISQEMQGPGPVRFAIDNHTRRIQLGGVEVAGNAMRLDQAVKDLWVAAELDLTHADVILSTPAQRALDAATEPELRDAARFDSVKRAAATTLATLRVPNSLGPLGSYHEALEDIRARRDVAEFRQFLGDLDASETDGAKLAAEISDAAYVAADEIARRYLGGAHWFHSIAIPAGRLAGNTLMAGLGTVLATAAGTPTKIAEKGFKNANRWAPFVVDLHRQRRG